VDGSTWGAAPLTIDSSGTIAGYPDLKVIDGNPAVAYQAGSDAYYLRSTTATGDLIADWAGPPVNLTNSTVCGGFTSLVVANGNPAVSYHNPVTMSVEYTRATNSTGQATVNWPATYTQIDPGNGGQNSDMAIIDGLPAVCYYKASNIISYKYCQALDASGDDWGSARHAFYMPLHTVGHFATLLQLEQGPGIGCRYQTEDCLVFLSPVFR